MVALEYQPNVAEVRETPNPISIFHSLSMAQLKLNYCCYCSLRGGGGVIAVKLHQAWSDVADLAHLQIIFFIYMIS